MRVIIVKSSIVHKSQMYDNAWTINDRKNC